MLPHNADKCNTGRLLEKKNWKKIWLRPIQMQDGKKKKKVTGIHTHLKSTLSTAVEHF